MSLWGPNDAQGSASMSGVGILGAYEKFKPTIRIKFDVISGATNDYCPAYQTSQLHPPSTEVRPLCIGRDNIPTLGTPMTFDTSAAIEYDLICNII